MSDNRRDFLKKSALLGLSGLASGLIGGEKINTVENVTKVFSEEGNTFTLPKLPYAFDALEPFIDKQTMEIHYSKHHKAYVEKLNAAITPDNIDFSVSDAAKCANVDGGTLPAIRNNLGGHYNHSLFWTLLKPNPKATPNNPPAKLLEVFNSKFGSFEVFKKDFSDRAAKVFGSGWCWVIMDEGRNFKIVTTPNQDNPLMMFGERGTPILALDVWEHAYYLKYQNRRVDYISNWWNVINWERVEELYAQK